MSEVDEEAGLNKRETENVAVEIFVLTRVEYLFSSMPSYLLSHVPRPAWGYEGGCGRRVEPNSWLALSFSRSL